MWTSDEFVDFGRYEGGDGLGDDLREGLADGLGGAADEEGTAFTPIAFDSLTAIDTDGDGVFETMVVQDGDDLTLVYDLDGDGLTDFQTDFTETGEPISWRDERDEDGQWHWRRIPGD